MPTCFFITIAVMSQRNERNVLINVGTSQHSQQVSRPESADIVEDLGEISQAQIQVLALFSMFLLQLFYGKYHVIGSFVFPTVTSL